MSDYSALAKRTQGYALEVKKLFDEAVKELLAIANAAKHGTGQMFGFDQTKAMADKAQKALRKLHAAVKTAIERGIELEWGKADKAADDLIATVFGKEALKDKRYSTMLLRNDSAMRAFINRVDNGMNLSNRVWRDCVALREEMELAITVSIGEGVPATTISRRVRQYLNEPDKLFRRVRKGTDADGNPIYGLSKAAAAYHPGRGVYRSSYKNAMRLARTETNMAYRNEDCNRVGKLDFVLGIRISLSNNHNCEGVPEGQFYDICDELQGDYPKMFKWSGWHPQCRCHMTTILPTREELNAYSKARRNGEKYTFKGMVKDYPDNFKAWIKGHEDKIDVAEQRGKLPYFIRDNKEDVDRILGKVTETPTVPQPFSFDHINDPHITYDANMSSRKPIEERLNNLMDGIEGAYGDVGAVKIIRSMDNSNPLTAKRNWDYLKRYRTEDNEAVYCSISHLNELRNADLSGVPEQWRGTLNALIGKINAHDMTKGCFGVYPEIEHAYNIYKLSTMKPALDYGLDKLSDKTPYTLFSVFVKKIDGMPIPPKEFFDKLDRFVPLITSGKGAYHSPTFKHVCIAATDKKIMQRLETSEWFRKGLVFHEYGHAMDNQKGLRSDKDLVKIFDDWKAEIGKDAGRALEDSINAVLGAERKKFYDWWASSDVKAEAEKAKKDAMKAGDFSAFAKASNAYDEAYEKAYREHLYNMEEQLGALSDCLSAVLEGKRIIPPRNHDKKYFSNRGSQLTEFIAHCSENYWNGNEYFKQLAPDLYQLMVDYFNGVQ